MLRENTTCDECGNIPSEVFCKECEQYLCILCNPKFHSGGNRKAHTRVCLINNFKGTTTNPLDELQKKNDGNFRFQEPEIFVKPFCPQNPIGIYWELPKEFPSTIQIKETVNKFKIHYPSLILIKVYGQDHLQYKDFLKENGIEFRICNDLKEIDAMIIDISLEHQNYSKILIISSRAYQFKSYIQQILSNPVKVNIKVSLTYTEIRELSIENANLHNDSHNEKILNHENSANTKEIYKICRRRAAASEDCLESCMIIYLKERALEGKIMYEFNELLENMEQYFKISRKNANDLITTAAKFGKLIIQNKKIGKIEMDTVSLKIEKINSDSLLCVLRSLKNDEMIPTEKAIQSRFKEVYDIKTPNCQFTSLLELCIKNQKEKSFFHKKASSDFSLFSQNESKNAKNLSFCVKKIRDISTGIEINAIYPVNEE